jgi:hypothetical protein
MPTNFASASAEPEVDFGKNGLTMQAVSFFLHSLIAVAAWLGMMLVGYLINPASVPQIAVLALSVIVPLIAGYIVARIRPSEMAIHIWLAGIIWILCMSLWVIDMPTGPNACLDCTAAEKLTRTFFSFPAPSGLLDDNGPFFATWPAAALIGYAIGARLVLGRTKYEEE